MLSKPRTRISADGCREDAPVCFGVARTAALAAYLGDGWSCSSQAPTLLASTRSSIGSPAFSGSNFPEIGGISRIRNTTRESCDCDRNTSRRGPKPAPPRVALTGAPTLDNAVIHARGLAVISHHWRFHGYRRYRLGAGIAALVLLMTPGLALFYGGMVRAKSVLNMMMMSFGALALVSVLWVLYGYSMAFGNDIGAACSAARPSSSASKGLMGTEGSTRASRRRAWSSPSRRWRSWGSRQCSPSSRSR